MLARLDPRVLPRLWFPLGGQAKDETRAQARAAGLAAAGRAESQEACFLAGADYRDFLARHGLPVRDGPILDEDGLELGRHRGFWRYTAGQRRGLGVATGRPLYALGADPRTNAVVVGPRESLALFAFLLPVEISPARQGCRLLRCRDLRRGRGRRV